MNYISNNEPFLSICITSYNRVKELKRCLESITSNYKDLIEIVISEDCSPKRHEIREMVEEFIQKSEYRVIFNSNTKNLGYDCNLGKLIELARGKYIIFMSDDDAFFNNNIDKTIDALMSLKCPMAFVPFYISNTNEFERKFEHDFKITPCIENVSKYIYCSILFSGLIFERNKILDYDAKRFKNLLYFQVYLFASVLYKHGGYYLNIPLISCIGDGENAFGISDSSIKNSLLANRKSIYSNLEYHKGLVQVIKLFDEDNGTNLINGFEKEYSLRSISGLLRARKVGRKEVRVYWNKMNEVGIRITFIAKIYYYFLLIFNYKFCDFCFSIPRKILKKYRSKAI